MGSRTESRQANKHLRKRTRRDQYSQLMRLLNAGNANLSNPHVNMAGFWGFLRALPHPHAPLDKAQVAMLLDDARRLGTQLNALRKLRSMGEKVEQALRPPTSQTSTSLSSGTTQRRVQMRRHPPVAAVPASRAIQTST
ncbi:hypothetical protein Taro_045105 [Colocasia esculenta]|uniref:Uncharacterized protein n=1 Tax=Colocasia esculenta TaxID=4460 RepID=A0A843X487_COLES|nr:hypothetical protein [Colocasia esculenta]